MTATGSPSSRARPVMIRAAEHAAHLEERALVDDRLDDRAHPVDLAAVARDRVEQQLLAPLADRRCAGRAAATLVDRGGQVGQEAPGAVRTPPPRCRPRGRRRRRASGSPSRRAPACRDACWPRRVDDRRAGDEHAPRFPWSSPSSGWRPAAPRRDRRPSRGRARPPARGPDWSS